MRDWKRYNVRQTGSPGSVQMTQARKDQRTEGSEPWKTASRHLHEVTDGRLCFIHCYWLRCNCCAVRKCVKCRGGVGMDVMIIRKDDG